MTQAEILKTVEALNRYTGKERFDRIVAYAQDRVDGAVVHAPAEFFAELLRRETQDVCKWYEINEIGARGDARHAEILFDVLRAADVCFAGGSSLHLIAAGALGRIGESVVPRALELWEGAGDATRIALIDTLGETHSEAAAKGLSVLCPRFNDKEFVYAARAFSKCGARGNELLRALYAGVSDPRKLCLIDAMGYGVENDAFVQGLLQSEGAMLARALQTPTKGARKLLGRICCCDGTWTEQDKETLSRLGVNFE